MRIVATCRWAAAIALVFALGTPYAFGGTGTPFTLPAGALPFAQNGLKLGISCDWVQGYGQRPIRLDLTSAKRVNFDRSLRIEVGLGNWGESRYVIVSTDVELPAGSLVVSKSVPVPQLASTVLMSVAWKGEDAVSPRSPQAASISASNSDAAQRSGTARAAALRFIVCIHA